MRRDNLIFIRNYLISPFILALTKKLGLINFFIILKKNFIIYLVHHQKFTLVIYQVMSGMFENSSIN
ncbi:hypothetical protein BpHYR1_049073 [Brachionus plicatilis]|uniref:Uncharacterized protein n=1 Tax=Brachionus plicatilis TaxID=10195 RepID=A0A3M7PZF7_BRAPC|nr:hypothetical protein BpHYR1_049073 [Brachionus plicatilis]